jgi:hypothetical protein
VKKSDSEEEQTSKDDSNEELVTNPTISNIALLFTLFIRDQFDRDAKEYGRFLQKQSCRYWKGSTYFFQFKKGRSRGKKLFVNVPIEHTSSCYEYYSSMLDPENGKKQKKFTLAYIGKQNGWIF